MDIILVFGIILIISVLSCKTTGKIGLPTLVGFILIGTFIGNWFNFNNMRTVEQICNFALLLIIFTGGFQTNIRKVKPVLTMSLIISLAGTVLTAFLAGSFAYLVLKFGFYESMLLGVIISSTDVASVFSVLHSKHMRLKHSLDDILEVESGSNEPFAHILTVVLIALAMGSKNVPLLFVQEIVFGALSGFVIAKLGKYLINWLNMDMDGLYGVLLCGIAFLTYGAAAQFGGSGFLAVYIGGIIIGNGKIVYKGTLTKLYSAVSLLMQITLFIILGMLCVPSSLVKVIGSGLLFALFLFFVARPVAMFVLMRPFKRPLNEIVFVSWAGFRGASSIVFATHLLTEKLSYADEVFHVVFFVCLLSVIVQSPFIILIAKKLKLINDWSDI